MEFEHAPNDPTRKELSPLLKLALELGPLGVFFLFNARGEQIAAAFPVLQQVGKPIFLQLPPSWWPSASRWSCHCG